MILAAANKLKQILWINYIGHVVPEDLKQCREDLEVLLVDLRPGFRLMVDLSQMESMGLDCRTELGAIMELISLAGAGRVVRVIPDPSKDIGFNILAFFHYRNHPQVLNCTNLKDGLEKLLA
jgi:hypothetical protein